MEDNNQELMPNVDATKINKNSNIEKVKNFIKIHRKIWIWFTLIILIASITSTGIILNLNKTYKTLTKTQSVINNNNLNTSSQESTTDLTETPTLGNVEPIGTIKWNPNVDEVPIDKTLSFFYIFYFCNCTK